MDILQSLTSFSHAGPIKTALMVNPKIYAQNPSQFENASFLAKKLSSINALIEANSPTDTAFETQDLPSLQRLFTTLTAAE